MAKTERLILSELVKRLHHAEADPLRPLIDRYLLTRDTPKAKGRYDGHAISLIPRRRPPGRLSPSSVYGCKRQAVLKFTGVKGRRRLDPDQELLFEDGNWRHHKWQYLFYDMEAVLGRNRFRVLSIEEVVALPDLYVAGSLDVAIAIRMKVDGRWVWRKYVIDIKGINRRGFDWINQTDAAKEDNIRQILLYMKAKRIPRGLLLYDCKDTNLTKTFQIDFSSEHWGETVEWINDVVALLERRRMPARHVDCRPGTMMHEGCFFRQLCWGKRDTTDLQELAFSNWQGIDAAWRRGLEELAA